MPLRSGRWATSRSVTTTASSTARSPTSSCRTSSTRWRTGTLRKLEVRRLGVVSYQEALAMQRALVEERRAGRVDDLLLLLEHPRVLTLGVRGDGGRSHVLATADALATRGIAIH